MGRELVLILICDICGDKSKVDQRTDGWLQWHMEHPVLKKSFMDRAICPVCLKSIKKELGVEED